jgi:hypothetical protein
MIAQEKRKMMMHFRPKPGIFTKSLKKSLKWRVFLEFTLKLLIPL